MTRREAITSINATLADLSDERLQVLADLARTWAQPTAFSSLSPAERAELDAAVDELDQGNVIGWDDLQVGLEAKLKAAGV